MKIQMTVSDSGYTWTEEYELPEAKSLDEAKKWAQEVITRFNSTLRPGEKQRTLVEVSIIDKPVSNLPHVWEKTNLVTIVRNGQVYDTVRCQRCGITGKRYGLSGATIDSKYRAKKYLQCTEKEQ